MSLVDGTCGTNFTITLTLSPAQIALLPLCGAGSSQAGDAGHGGGAVQSVATSGGIDIAVGPHPVSMAGTAFTFSLMDISVQNAPRLALPAYILSKTNPGGSNATETVTVLCLGSNDNTPIHSSFQPDPWAETLFHDTGLVVWFGETDVLQQCVQDAAPNSQDMVLGRNPYEALFDPETYGPGPQLSRRSMADQRAFTLTTGLDRFTFLTLAAALSGVQVADASFSYSQTESDRQPVARLDVWGGGGTASIGLSLTDFANGLSSKLTSQVFDDGADQGLGPQLYSGLEVDRSSQEGQLEWSSRFDDTGSAHVDGGFVVAVGSAGPTPQKIADNDFNLPAEKSDNSLSASDPIETPISSSLGLNVIEGDRGADGAFAPTEDILFGTDGDDFISGGELSDELHGNGGNDVLLGGPGDDLLEGGPGDDILDGGAGHDTAHYSGDQYSYSITVNYDGSYTVEDLRGEAPDSSGPDGTDRVSDVETFAFETGTIDASDLYHVEPGSSHGQTISSESAIQPIDEVLDGSEISEGVVIDGGAGNDKIYGGSGNDLLIGGTGSDDIVGGAGNDVLIGGSGADELNGGGDNDLLLPGYGADVVDGGEGNDWVSYQGEATGFLIHLADQVVVSIDDGETSHSGSVRRGTNSEAPDASAAIEDVLDNIENATGGLGDDVIIGTGADNILAGGSGDDVLVGLGGNDILIGGTGNHDAAVYLGNSNEYEFEFLSSDELLVHDLVDNRDGDDDLSGIEFLRFHDSDLKIEDLYKSTTERQSDTSLSNTGIVSDTSGEGSGDSHGSENSGSGSNSISSGSYDLSCVEEDNNGSGSGGSNGGSEYEFASASNSGSSGSYDLSCVEEDNIGSGSSGSSGGSEYEFTSGSKSGSSDFYDLSCVEEDNSGSGSSGSSGGSEYEFASGSNSGSSDSYDLSWVKEDNSGSGSSGGRDDDRDDDRDDSKSGSGSGHDRDDRHHDDDSFDFGDFDFDTIVFDLDSHWEGFKFMESDQVSVLAEFGSDTLIFYYEFTAPESFDATESMLVETEFLQSGGIEDYSNSLEAALLDLQPTLDDGSNGLVTQEADGVINPSELPFV